MKYKISSHTFNPSCNDSGRLTAHEHSARALLGQVVQPSRSPSTTPSTHHDVTISRVTEAEHLAVVAAWLSSSSRHHAWSASTWGHCTFTSPTTCASGAGNALLPAVAHFDRLVCPMARYAATLIISFDTVSLGLQLREYR